MYGVYMKHAKVAWDHKCACMCVLLWRSKPRNILLVRLRQSGGTGEEVSQLCDLDAAVEIGHKRPPKLKTSSGYCSPQVARLLLAALLGAVEAYVANAKYDVWSLGIVLFELCSGETFFPQAMALSMRVLCGC